MLTFLIKFREVMTTEVYRNMLYSADADQVTDNLFAVVIDEFHYLNQRERGTVWEESVTISPQHVLLVALSATMSNAADVRDWFDAVHGPTTLVETSHRPVPLRFGFCGHRGYTELFANDSEQPAAAKGFNKPERKRKDQKGRPRLNPRLMRDLQESALLQTRSRERGKRRISSSDRLERALNNSKELDKLIQTVRGRKSMRGRRDAPIPSYQFVLRALRRREMLPVIFFIFSRRGCDEAAQVVAHERKNLVEGDQDAELQLRLDEFERNHPALVQQERIDLARLGIASHHAGLLPIWKSCVEELFQDGLIKVVFATETLAAGINMPARTTVISQLAKRAGDEGIVQLSTSEVLQMGGRAGRRGKDTLGHSVIMESRFEGVLDAYRVVTANVDALTSRFTPSYGMVLNLLQTRSLDESKQIVDRSFGNFLRMKRARDAEIESENKAVVDAEDEHERAAIEAVLKECRAVMDKCSSAEIRSYNRVRERLKAEQRALHYIRAQSKQFAGAMIEDTLPFAAPGTRLILREPMTSKVEKRTRNKNSFKEGISTARSGQGPDELISFYLGDLEDDNLVDDVTASGAANVQTTNAVLLDMCLDSDERQTYYAAIDETAQYRIVNHSHVVRVFFDEDDASFSMDEAAPEWREFMQPERANWISLGGHQFTAEAPAELDEVIEASVKWLRQVKESLPENGDDRNGQEEFDFDPHVNAQEKRVEDALKDVVQHPLHEGGVGVRTVKAKMVAGQMEVMIRERFGGKRKRAKRRREQASQDADVEVELEEDTNWGDFMSIAGLLQAYGFLDDEYRVTEWGRVGAKIRAENELWTALVVLDGATAAVSPVELAALIAATQMEGGRDAYVDAEPSSGVLKAVEALDAQRMRLLAMQAEYGTDSPVCLDVELVGVVELWARGMEWSDLLEATSLQEGDLCRMLRRNLDLLRQIPRLPGINDELKRNARRAIALLDRFPIVDDITYAVQVEEKFVGSEIEEVLDVIEPETDSDKSQ